MDLASMLDREDFFPSFFLAVKNYYKEAYGKDIIISLASNKKECNMVIKPYLSAATSVHASEKAREFFYSEWNIRNSIIKNGIAKIYVSIMTRTGKLFSQFYFSFQPETELSRDMVIAPNNRSIRFFDYGNDVVGCIVKSGFTDKYFNNQLEFRKKYHYDFMVPLLKSGKNWFQEPIMHGHPLARITENERYQKGINDCIYNMGLIAKDTIHFLSSDVYYRNLYDRVMKLIDIAEEKKKITKANESREIITRRFLHDKLANIMVPVVISHGDLQTGNIWLDNEDKIWIYDWETVGERSVWYDAGVLLYSLRRPKGWFELVPSSRPNLLTINDPHKNYSDEEFVVIKDIILFEDICFYLEDMLELPDTWGNELYDAYIARIMKTGIIN